MGVRRATKAHIRPVRARRKAAVGALSLALLAAIAVLGAAPAHAATSTVVSLTFDDGQSSQYATLPMLQSRGLKGTYYVNSGDVGSSDYYMPWSQIHELYNAGNEIGGHTVHHTDLTTVSTSVATAEVCDDRTALTNQGLGPITSFAYPYASVNATAESVVRSCGYASGRGVGGATYAESIPPGDPEALLTPEPATTSTTLQDLESTVTNAETHGGGWVIETFHGICDNQCAGSNSLRTSIFTAFLDWLAQRSANGTVVRTVGDVMANGNTPPPPSAPTTSITCNGSACSAGWYATAPVTVRLAANPSSGTTTFYTTDGTDPTTSGTRTQYSGPFSVAATTTVRYYSADTDGHSETPKSQKVQVDTTSPTNVAIGSPPSGTSVRRHSTVALTASATDPVTGTGTPSGIQKVVFRDRTASGTAVIGTVTTPNSFGNYVFTWNPVKAAIGQHWLTAVATDVAGNSATSAEVPVTLKK